MLQDKFGRDIHDLRLSVTDRCNFSCVYCKSADPKNYFPHRDLLTWDEFLRCHYTNQARRMERRLVPVVLGAALHFHKDVVQIVSAYRAPKYNLMLRKKGHEVARQSQHTQGTAVDFRIPGVGTQALLDHVRSLHAGGVGFYPDSAFVHADTGPVRYWTGR